MKIPTSLSLSLVFLASAPIAKAALTNYWPLNETTGTNAPSTAAGGTDATLFPGADWVTDPLRGQVLGFDGIDGYATAGVLPGLELETKFTWAFWARSNMTANNNIMIGNRFPDQGWIKFTTNAFEYRDIAPTFNESIDYPDFPVDAWVHHAVVKNGQLFTYYRNGVALGNTWNTGVMPADTPFYFGGDTINENWSGSLDDIATWTDALSTNTIAGLFGNKFTPATAPLTDIPPGLTTIFSDDFSGDLSKWFESNRGLEQNGEAGYNPADNSSGAAVLGGTANAQFWYGRSLESADVFDSRKYTEVSVTRTSLTGTGVAYRSSVWIFGDAGHYLHLSQNIGEGGWTINAQDVGGTGGANATGGGVNLDGVDALDADGGSHQIKIRVLPTGITGSVNIEVQIDGVAQVVRGFTNFPDTFNVILTGQARTIDDSVSAVFDNVTVAQPVVNNTAPVFSQPSYLLPSGAVGTAYSNDLAPLVFDQESDTLTFTKVSGPTWANISPAGLLTGTPDAGVSVANLLVRVTDPSGGEATATLIFRVNNPAAATPPLFGWWPLNETSGSSGADISGGGNRANFTNATTGGLGAEGSVWVNDTDFGNVASFNGNDGLEAGWAVVGSPPTSGTLPVMDLTRSFTWSFWAKPTFAANNDIIIGNRYNATGAEYGVVQFTKFTGSAFEWHLAGNNQLIDYTDLDAEVWAHHVVVKDGASIFYYKDGVLSGGRALTNAFTEPLPIFFGGGTNGVEAWGGYLHDVRLFNGALNEAAVNAVFTTRGDFAAVSPTFTASLYFQPGVTADTAVNRSIAALASDPQNDALTFSKVSGPDWLSVSPAGVITGTPDLSSPTANVVVRVQDPDNNAANTTFIFRVEDPALTAPAAFGTWPLDDGTGSTARDTSGNDLAATITSVDTGGLSDTGSAWLSDPERGTVLSFNGIDDATGANAVVGAPPGTGTLPFMDLSTSFTWAFWAKPALTANNDIILGNRFNETGVDFAPVQFIKFTGTAFEWNVNGTDQRIDYPDLVPGVWAHHAIVKEGNSLFYYRDGVLTGQRTITVAPTASLPIYFGGGFNGVENWSGSLSDVRLFNGSSSEAAIAALAAASGGSDGSLVFTSVTMAANRAVTLQWNGEAGKTYTVQASKTTTGFETVGESTTNSFTFQPGHPDFNTAVETRLFFRVLEKITP